MSFYTFDTVWPADSVEFCPHPDAANLFVCGTYHLEKDENKDNGETDDEAHSDTQKPQVRRGKCTLFAVEGNDELSELCHVQLPAVLDMKWCSRAQGISPVLGVADSEGGISLQELDVQNRTFRQLQRLECATSNILCLSLDWSNRRHPTSNLGDLIVSLSDGSLSLLQPDESGKLSVRNSWHAHDYEPWIAAWNYWNPNVAYSGGDDLTMKGWDLRQEMSEPTFTNKRFEAGVTTIQSHPFIEHLLAVGSYNDTVYLFDVRNPLKALSRTNVEGGAWRVKWHPAPQRSNDLLVACMHAGCKVLRFNVSGGEDGISVSGDGAIIRRLEEHESMAYGVDWSYTNEGGEGIIASCSFYDHKLCLWRG